MGSAKQKRRVVPCKSMAVAAGGVCVHWFCGKLSIYQLLCPLILLTAWLWDLLALREELGSRLDWIWDWQRRRSRNKSITCCDFRGRQYKSTTPPAPTGSQLRIVLFSCKQNLFPLPSDAASDCKERLLMCSPVDRADLKNSLWHLLYSQLRDVK